MKKLLTIFLFGLSTNLFAQEGYYKMISSFYSIIDSTKSLKCCDTGYCGISLTYEIPLYEYPSSDLNIDEYEMEVTQNGYLESYVDDLVKAYYKICEKERKQITKSCFKLGVDYKINRDITSDGLYWIEGTLKVRINFQGEDPKFGQSWLKRCFYKICKKKSNLCKRGVKIT